MDDMATAAARRRGRTTSVVLVLTALAALGILTDPSQYYGTWARQSRVTSATRSATNHEPDRNAELPDVPRPIQAPPPAIDAVVGNPKEPAPPFVLDFAIVGYPKTATSFVLGWLAEHEQVLAHTSEMYELQQGRVDEFVAAMSRLAKEPSNTSAPPTPSEAYKYRRGYKAPRDLQNPVVMKVLQDHWPETRLLVGLRHPVLWFESFYNYRFRKGVALPSPNSSEFLRQPTCTPSLTHGVCVNDARFHVPLAKLGKTPLTSPRELQLLLMNETELAGWHRQSRSRHKIFLYEMSQVYESTQPSQGRNATAVARRAEQFRHDMARFLGLTTPLSGNYSEPGHYLPNRTKFLQICDSQHSELRRQLMENARAASTWIREYLLVESNAGDVVVSSPRHFDALLRTWMVDPCQQRVGSGKKAR